jgi:hypothetical protein
MRTAPLPPPDNGCTRCDLVDSVRLLTGVMRDRLPGRVLAPLVADCAGDPQLRARLIATLVAPSRDSAATAVQRAVGRGDLRPDVDPALIVELLASVVYQRALLGGALIDESEVGPLVDTILRGVAVSRWTSTDSSRSAASTGASPSPAQGAGRNSGMYRNSPALRNFNGRAHSRRCHASA